MKSRFRRTMCVCVWGGGWGKEGCVVTGCHGVCSGSFGGGGGLDQISPLLGDS